MSALMLLSVVLLPLLLAAASLVIRHPTSLLSVIAPVPALLLVFLLEQPPPLRLDWLLLRTGLGLDASARLLLPASALVWLIAMIHAAGEPRGDPRGGRFRLFSLLAMCGNFTLILAQDMLTFYLGFALMGLSAYGLVAHRGSEAARRAGRLYLGWTLLGEMALFSALVQLASAGGGLDFSALRGVTPPPVAVALLVLGFGIKLALPGLHTWLPLSYAAAPAAGAAVLSGPMISAGLLGWMRFLPPGDQSLAPWGLFLVAIGLCGVALGTGVGLLQRDPKVVLGYSSIGKMGLLSAGFGIALIQPAAAPSLLAALTLYLLHHLLVKSALFLGLDLLQGKAARPWILGGLTLLALALAGAPLTSGALAKSRLLEAVPEALGWFGAWLMLAAFASTLLMGRLLYLLFEGRIPTTQAVNRAVTAWVGLILVILTLPWLLQGTGESLSGAGPLIAGLLSVLLVGFTRPRLMRAWVGRIPPGDMLETFRGLVYPRYERCLQRCNRVTASAMRSEPSRFRDALAHLWVRWRGRLRMRRSMDHWAGVFWLVLAGLLGLTLLIGD